MTQRPLVSEDTFRTLLELVLSGRYEPGERLPTQRKLAAELGVTMTALREALKRLEQMGLVEVRHGDAMRVRDWRNAGGLDVIAHLLFRSGGLDAKILGDVFEARGLMLAELAAMAAQKRTPEQARRLTELAAAIGEAADDTAAQQIDFEFFTELAHVADNVVFILIMNSIRALYFENAALLPVTAHHEELVLLYAGAAQAIEHGQAPAARKAIADLAERQQQRVRTALGG